LLIILDKNSKRPLAGYAVFNEAFIDYKYAYFQSQVATFVHEVLHALYFHPILFTLFPKNKYGESYLFRDKKNIWKMRGDNILSAIRSHYKCSTIDGGKR
jgi:hypothetical protein